MTSSDAATAAGPIRLAILEADTPLPQTAAQYKTYGGVFTSLFARALAPDPVSSALTITAHGVVANPTASPSAPYYPDLDSVDAILVTGSRHSAFGDEPWIAALAEYVRRAVDGHRVRVVGVCFGHQIVGRALGVPVAKGVGGWEVSVTDIKLSEKGREVFGGRETLKIHQMHRDEVFSYPEGAVSLAENDVCPIQGMLIPGRVITVQGHPEFTEDIVRELLETRHYAGIFPDEVYESGIARVADEHDGVAIAQAFLRFLKA